MRVLRVVLWVMFMLTLLREHAKATRRSGAPLSHVLLVEEAHVVIGRADGAGAVDRANSKAVATRLFTRALAEMRALGEGIVIADQLPTAIAPEAIKNTSIKVMHRLVSADDRSELGQAMIFDAGQIEQAATLPPGRAFAHIEGWARPRLIAEPDFKATHYVEEPPDDSSVSLAMASIRDSESLRTAYLPYRGCENVCRTCSSRVREEMERASRGAILDIAEADDESHQSEMQTRLIVAFMDRAKIATPSEDELVEVSIERQQSSTPDERLRDACAGIILAEVLLPRFGQQPRRS